MSDQQEKPAKRGEAAWIEQRDEIAKRNAQTRKAGRAQREAYERGRQDDRDAAEKRRLGELAAARRGRSGRR